MIRQTGTIFFAALMLFSTTGVAVYHHICQCYLADSSVQQAGPGSHCKLAINDVDPTASCCSGSEHTCCSKTNHKGCRNEVTYLRAPIVSILPAQEESINIPSVELSDCRMPDAGYPDAADSCTPFWRSSFTPPQIRGSLIIFLHTLKIPSPDELS